MPQFCCAFGCNNKRNPGCKLQFFKFPFRKPEQLHKWVEALNRENFTPSQYHVLCSDHFTAKDYLLRPNINIPRLRDDAVPSVFNDNPPALQKLIAQEEDLKKQSILTYENISSVHQLIKEEIHFDDPLSLNSPPVANVGRKQLKIRPIQFISTINTGICIKKEAVEDPLELHTSAENKIGSNQLSDVKVVQSVHQLKPKPIRKTEAVRKEIKMLQQKLRRRQKTILELKALQQLANKTEDSLKTTASTSSPYTEQITNMDDEMILKPKKDVS